MSRNLGIPGGTRASVPPVVPAGPLDGAAVPAVPAATRTRSPGWRDPRLWIGLALVAASVLVGVRVLAAADDTVEVWAVRADVAAGAPLTADDLVATRVRFAAEDDLDRYFAADDALPDDAELLRPLGAGELLPRAAVGEAGAGDRVEVSLAVSRLRVPTGVGPGAVVDVWLLGDAAGGREARGRDDGPAAPVLEEVTVVDAPLPDEVLGASGERQLVLSVPADAAPDLYARLAAVDDPVVAVSLHP